MTATGYTSGDPTKADAAAMTAALASKADAATVTAALAGKASTASVTPGEWLAPTFNTGAGIAVVGNPTVDPPAFRLESPVSGLVRARGSVGITGASPQFAQSAPFMKVPVDLRPSVPRVMSDRTRGGSSTHTILVVLVNGDVYCANTPLNTGSDVPLDGLTYTL